MFFKANQQEANSVKEFLSLYGLASGQYINFDKSIVCFINNVGVGDRKSVGNIMGVRSEGGNGRYLGLPMRVGRNRREVLGYVKERIIARIESWNHKFLSRACRVVLLKSVIQAIPSYTMGVFLLPVGLCKEIEIVMNFFWWKGGRRENKGVHWKS